MDVIKRLDDIMEKMNLTDYKLALISGLSSSTISNMRKRNTVPSFITLETICKALGISLSQFFASDDENFYPVTLQEREFLDYYVLMSDNQQNLFLELAKNTDLNPLNSENKK